MPEKSRHLRAFVVLGSSWAILQAQDETGNLIRLNFEENED
jgi:hypothetical protein